MDKHLQWKVVSLVGYVALLVATLVMGADDTPVLPLLRLAAPV